MRRRIFALRAFRSLSRPSAPSSTSCRCAGALFRRRVRRSFFTFRSLDRAPTVPARRRLRLLCSIRRRGLLAPSTLSPRRDDSPRDSCFAPFLRLDVDLVDSTTTEPDWGASPMSSGEEIKTRPSNSSPYCRRIVAAVCASTSCLCFLPLRVRPDDHAGDPIGTGDTTRFLVRSSIKFIPPPSPPCLPPDDLLFLLTLPIVRVTPDASLVDGDTERLAR